MPEPMPHRRSSTHDSNNPGPSTVAGTVSLENIPDAELARRIAAGDDAAFDRFYGENVGRVHAVCLRMSGDATRARSLTQESFVRAWQRIGSFRGESRLSSWLHRLTVNVVLESERSRRRWHGLLAAPEQGTDRATREADPGLRVDLERAIARLPEGCRAAFVLHDVEGFEHNEVAKLLGVSEGTSKSQVHKARMKLRAMLSGEPSRPRGQIAGKR